MTSYFVLFSFVLFFYFSEEHRFINIKEVKTDLRDGVSTRRNGNCVHI